MDQSTSSPTSVVPTSYDEAPYPSSSFAESHPDKICAMARLFGLNAATPNRARVLEIGCADGANILPMAQHAPNARFLGIDASSKQIGMGQTALIAAGLSNVELRCQNILDFPKDEGKFDYIIAHGIYSWVPNNVRQKMLAICRDHLSENGVAYISYNAYPGWGMRMALRDMLLFHTANFTDTPSKVQQARALTNFLMESMPTEGNPFGLLLKQELERMKTLPDNYIRHDILSEENQPFYFHQFMQQAIGAGLQYLSESSLDQMLASNFPPKVAETLDKVGGNIIAREQYMDFVRNRNFRQTLLCHGEVKLARNITPESIKSFYFTSLIARPDQIDLAPGVEQVFKLRTGGSFSMNASHSFVKAIFLVLSECGLKRISFTELLEAARAKCGARSELADAPDRASIEEATLTANLLPLYTKGVITLYADRPDFIVAVPGKPKVTPLVRFQALHSRQVTNRAHQPIPFELIGRYIVAECDGKKDVGEIAESLLAAVKAGKLRIAENDKPVEDEDRLRAILEDRVKTTLLQITALGFLTE